MITSIIIPSYFMNKPGKIITDGDEQLWFAENCFKRILRYTKDFELILIDNGSVHGKDLLNEYADILITNDKNLGFAKAVNQGFRRATGEYICVVNNDIFVYQGWLEALIKTFKDNPDCGVAMPALMKQTKRGDEALQITEIDLTKNFGKYGKGAEFGSCWLTKREILDKVGLFDENFKIGFGEDRDMWRRMRIAGYDTYRTHETRVFHQGNVSMSRIPNRKSYTGPNRIYLQKITELEKEGKRLSEEEKIQIRSQSDIEYKGGLSEK